MRPSEQPILSFHTGRGSSTWSSGRTVTTSGSEWSGHYVTFPASHRLTHGTEARPVTSRQDWLRTVELQSSPQDQANKVSYVLLLCVLNPLSLLRTFMTTRLKTTCAPSKSLSPLFCLPLSEHRVLVLYICFPQQLFIQQVLNKWLH